MASRRLLTHWCTISGDSFRSSCQPWPYSKPIVSRRNQYGRIRWTWATFQKEYGEKDKLDLSPVCMDSIFMTPIHAKVASTEKYGDQYRLIVDLVQSEFLGPFERLRFKRNPYCGSFSASLSRNWLTLTYRKDPGFKAGDTFPLSRTD